MPVRMELSRILIRELTDMQIIELREVAGDKEPDGGEPEGTVPGAGAGASKARTFPIVIGLPEAHAIERGLGDSVLSQRPQTHDLLASVITALGGTLQSVTINDLSGGTFYANLAILQDGKVVNVDSRPSDAIALGIAGKVPIFVAEHVLSNAAAEEQ